jgi:hypothetical protein
LPPGAEGISDLVSTTRFTAEQEWSPDQVAPRVGDALKRTVSRQAEDVSGMAITPLAVPDLPGVGIYPAEPRVEDSADRGSLTGRRTETLTYVFERAGSVSIPDIELAWWNLADERLETLTLPGRALEVLPGPASTDVSSASTGAPSRSINPWLAGAILFTVVLLVRLTPSLVRRWTAWNRSRLESEARYFRHAIASVRSGDSRRALRDIMRWLDLCHDGKTPARVREVVVRYGDEHGVDQIDKLQQAAADNRILDDPEGLATQLREIRQRRRSLRRRAAAACVLPELNRGCLDTTDA